MELRPCQLDVIARANVYQRPLIVAATAFGKTVVAAEMIRREPNAMVLFVVHRRELVHQAVSRLADFGITAGMLLAGAPTNAMARVQVATVQTLTRRDLPPARIVFIDEAHHAPARSYRKVLEAYPDARVIGLTATPCRGDGRGLGSLFEAIVEAPSTEELIKDGYLVGTKVYAPSEPDLKGVHTRCGDYVQSELAARVDRPELVGDIVSHWIRLAESRRTILFATGVAHSIHLTEEFVRLGVKAEHIDGSTPTDLRDAILQRLANGETRVVCNCGVLTEGFDCPAVECIVLARPTKSFGLFKQMIGRGLRPCEGKAHCLVLDHAGATHRHGFAEDPISWSLCEDTKAAPALSHPVRGLTLPPLHMPAPARLPCLV